MHSCPTHQRSGESSHTPQSSGLIAARLELGAPGASRPNESTLGSSKPGFSI